MGLTGGVILSNTKVPGAEKFKITTLYAAYAIPFFDIKGATILPAFSYSKAGGSKERGGAASTCSSPPTTASSSSTFT